MHYDWHHTTTFEETNLVGNIYFANFLSWQGACREMFLLQYAPEVVGLLQRRELALVTTYCHCDFIDQVGPLEHIIVRMKLKALNTSSLSMTFEYFRTIVSPDTLVASGSQEVRALSQDGQQYVATRLPDALCRLFS
jgi:enediyne biosynthesis thioesterase